MNQKAIFRSNWEDGSVETDCEVTPSGEIINIETIEPQFDAQQLESQEVELKTSEKVFQVTTTDEGDLVITENHPSIRYQMRLLDGILFPYGNEKVSYLGYGIFDGLEERWMCCPTAPEKPYIAAGGPSATYLFPENVDMHEWSKFSSSIEVSNKNVAISSRYDNRYDCPKCHHQWGDTHDRSVIDSCSQCGEKNIIPSKSELVCHIADVSISASDIERFTPYIGVAGGVPGFEIDCCVYSKMVCFSDYGYAFILHLYNSTEGVYSQGVLYTLEGNSLADRVASTAHDYSASIAGEWELPAIDGSIFMIGLSIAEPKTISLPVFGIEVTLTGDYGGAITSMLHEGYSEYDAGIDAIESMILAHAIAGIDISSASYLEGIEIAVLSLANNTADETGSGSMNMVTGIHPDSHNQNATLTRLDSGVYVSVAINLSTSAFSSDESTVAKELVSTVAPLLAQDGIESIDVEIGIESSN